MDALFTPQKLPAELEATNPEPQKAGGPVLRDVTEADVNPFDIQGSVSNRRGGDDPPKDIVALTSEDTHVGESPVKVSDPPEADERTLSEDSANASEVDESDVGNEGDDGDFERERERERGPELEAEQAKSSNGKPPTWGVQHATYSIRFRNTLNDKPKRGHTTKKEKRAPPTHELTTPQFRDAKKCYDVVMAKRMRDKHMDIIRLEKEAAAFQAKKDYTAGVKELSTKVSSEAMEDFLAGVRIDAERKLQEAKNKESELHAHIAELELELVNEKKKVEERDGEIGRMKKQAEAEKVKQLTASIMLHRG